jgi:hypothetical protein
MAKNSDGSVAFARETLSREEWLEDTKWEHGIDSAEAAKAEIGRDQSRLDFDADLMLRFLTTVDGLKQWVFHQADDDYFPSVPHDHYQGAK